MFAIMSFEGFVFFAFFLLLAAVTAGWKCFLQLKRPDLYQEDQRRKKETRDQALGIAGAIIRALFTRK